MAWKEFKLSDISKVKGGKRLPKGETLVPNNTGFPYIRVTDMTKYGVNTNNMLFVPSAIQKGISRYIITTDDIYITIAGTIGMVGVIPDVLNGANLTENAARICINDNQICKEYLMYFLSSNFVKNQIAASTSKNAQPKLAIARINSILVKAPPHSEQKNIAHILSILQKAIQKQEEIIATTQALKKSLLNKLFTEGTKGEALKPTDIGMIPESWEVITLGMICERISLGYQPEKAGSKKYVGLEHIESSAISIGLCGKESDVKSGKSVFKNGHILYGKLRPYLDKCAIANFDGICSTDILVLNGMRDVSNKFLVHLLHTDKFLAFAQSSTTGVQHPRTSWNTLKHFALGLPTAMHERDLIISSLDALHKKLCTSSSKKQIFMSLFNTFLNELMTGSIRVNDIDFNPSNLSTTKTKLKLNSLPV